MERRKCKGKERKGIDVFYQVLWTSGREEFHLSFVFSKKKKIDVFPLANIQCVFEKFYEQILKF